MKAEDLIVVSVDDHLVDNIAWECDYPHSDSPWPEAPEELALAAAHVPNEELARMTYENACRWYSFDPFVHRSKDRSTVAALWADADGHDVSIRALETGRFENERNGANLQDLASRARA